MVVHVLHPPGKKDNDMAQDQIVPMLFQRFSDEFKTSEWSLMLSGPYEVTNPLQTMVMEAGAKGMAVVIQAALVPIDVLFPEIDELPDPEQPSEGEAD